MKTKKGANILDSTSLSQCFAQQGIKISIRKGRRIRRLISTKDSKKDSDKEDEAPKPNYKRIEISSYLAS